MTQRGGTIFASCSPDALVASLQGAGLRERQAIEASTRLHRGYLVEGAPWHTVVTSLSKPARKAVTALDLRPAEMTVAQVAPDPDGTRRLLLRCADGDVIETVIIVANTPDHRARTTVCVSSQVGCGRGCVFCETGRLGLKRQLSAAEIVGQLRAALLCWQDRPAHTAPITNIVFMGMGEPLDNLETVLTAIEIMTDDRAFALSARRITVSTVGVAAKIPEFLGRTKANLAISLNAPDDARRARMMPVGKRTTMADIRKSLVDHLQPGRDVMFEYILFDGVNDADADADTLADWFDGLPARCNLIPANPGPDPTLRQPPLERALAFQKRLLDAGVQTMVRYPHGRDVGGACGQLAGLARSRAEQGE